MNFKLRLALDRAKASNMPQDSITRAVKRGSGEGSDGESLEQVTYEGYGPGGGAILLQAVTTNRNRTASDVRSAFNRGGGNLGESGCVAWNFDLRGVVTIDIDDDDKAEELGLLAIDVGAEDIQIDEGVLDIFSPIESLQDVQKAVESEGVAVRSAEMSMVPKTTIALGDKEAEQTLRLLDALEDLDDIQKAFTNADFPPEVLERYQAS
jgi:YebC/PmpR family DNA-binding regulatory protein